MRRNIVSMEKLLDIESKLNKLHFMNWLMLGTLFIMINPELSVGY